MHRKYYFVHLMRHFQCVRLAQQRCWPMNNRVAAGRCRRRERRCEKMDWSVGCVGALLLLVVRVFAVAGPSRFRPSQWH